MTNDRPNPPARAHLRWWAWPIAITLAFLLLQPVIGSGWALFPDSYRYAKQAQQILGSSADDAHREALAAFCESRAAQQSWRGTWVPRDEPVEATAARADACIDDYVGSGDVTTTDPRYQSIFTSRPGYPLLAAPFIAALGIVDGMRILGYAIACAGGIAAYAMLRAARLRPAAAAIGQCIFLISPLGWWALQGLGEGLVSLAVLSAIGGTLLVRGGRVRVRVGLSVIAASWAVLAVVRFSTLLLAAAALAVACTALATWVDRTDPVHRRHMWITAGAHASAAALTLLAMPILNLPGSEITLQDTFTKHFSEPLVPDPWRRLLDLNIEFWPQWLGTPADSYLLLGCTLAGVVALARWRRDLLWIALAMSATGFAHVAAHPLPREAERLGLLMWLPVVIGLAVAVDALLERFPPRANVPAARVSRRSDARDVGMSR